MQASKTATEGSNAIALFEVFGIVGKRLHSRALAAMRDASICGLGQAAPNPLLSVIKYFPEEVGLATGQGAPPPKPAVGIVT